MLRIALLQTILLVPSVCLWAQPPAGYYDPAAGLSGPALRLALHELINDHNILANSELWNAFESTDARIDGSVWDMYSDVPGGMPPYVFQFVEDQCGSYDSEGDCFNREHTFPQSWYGSSSPMSTDLFHIYPTDAWVNQQRGNWPYGTVSTADWTSQNGGKRGACNWPGCTGTVFEPIDAYKGDLARGYFYMLTRYLPQAPSWSAPILSNGEFLPWCESLLLAWHALDPVSPKEVDRNNAVFALQGNRNPYIDTPEWVTAIWGPAASISERDGWMARLWTAEGSMYVELAEANGSATLYLHDASGRLLEERQLMGAHHALVLDIPQGIYIAVLVQGKGRLVERVVR